MPNFISNLYRDTANLTRRPKRLLRRNDLRSLRRRPRAEPLERRELLAFDVFSVNTLADSVAADEYLSLREAVQVVNHRGDALQALGRELTVGEQGRITSQGGPREIDVIMFDPGLSADQAAVLMLESQLEVRENVRIEGPGSDLLSIDAGESTQVAASPELLFDFSVIAGDLSPELRLFGSADPSQAPFTSIRYGQGELLSLVDLPALDDQTYLEGLTFTFGSDDPASVVEAATLSFFDDGTGDGVAKQFYTHADGNDPTVNLSIGGKPFATAELVEINLFVEPDADGLRTFSPESSPSSMRLTSLLDTEYAAAWEEIQAATGGTGLIPFSLSDFQHAGQPVGISDAAIFESVGQSVLSPQTGSRIFDIRGTEGEFIAVEIQGLTVQNGLTQLSQAVSSGEDDDTFTGFGGAILNVNSLLTITQSAIRNSRAEEGGGIYSSGGSLSVLGSIIDGNSAAYAGGGIYVEDSIVEAWISASAISNNSSDYGGGIANYYDSRLIVADSAIFGNEAQYDGGGIDNFGGSQLEILNTTISGNIASDGAGIWNGEDSSVRAVSATIVANQGRSDADVDGFSSFAFGGGIYVSSFDAEAGLTTLHNTIVAGNTVRLPDATVIAADLTGGDVDPASSHNLIADAQSAGGLLHGQGGNQVGMASGQGTLPLADILDPALGRHGGPTPSHRLIADSPAIDAGDRSLAVYFDDSSADAIEFDQRGPGFDRVIGDEIDLGAVEWNPASTPWRNPTLPRDVSDDGFVTALDALIIINYLGRAGSETPLSQVERSEDDPYYDVNGDSVVTPIDALIVINHLQTAGNPSGESELRPQWEFKQFVPEISKERDEVIAAWDPAADWIDEFFGMS